MPELKGGERLDLYLVRLGWAASRRAAREMVASGGVHVNGRRYRKGELVGPGDHVDVVAATPSATIAPNSDLWVETLYEDSAVLVVNKPGLIPCHPLRPDERDTVMNSVVAAYPETAIAGDKPLEGGLVHRLDNGTSGALIIARTNEAFAMMRDAIRHGRVVRRYQALALGSIDKPCEIASPIAHHPKNVRKMVAIDLGHSEGPMRPVDGGARHADGGIRHAGGGMRHIAGATRRYDNGRPAATMVEPLEHIGAFTLISVIPRTGRRHQVRVHLASMNHSLAGDELYGGPALEGLAPGRFWLHLAHLGFDSPAGGRVEAEAPLPADLRAALERCAQVRRPH